MTENNPSITFRSKRKAYHRLLTARMDVGPLGKAYNGRWGLRLIDRPIITTKQKLMAALNDEVVLRPGTDGLHTHPDLHGVEFSLMDCINAANAALSAQKALLLSRFPPDEFRQLPTTQALISDERFRAAAKSCDSSTMLSMALKQVLAARRMKELAPGNGVPEIRRHAAEDVRDALSLAREFREAEGRPLEELSRNVLKMFNLKKRNLDASDYRLALMALESRRRNEQLTDPNLQVDVLGTVVTDELIRKKEILNSLNAFEKGLIMKVVGAKDLDIDGLSSFLSMHPGKRELLLQRGINRQWLSSEWKNGLRLYQDVYQSIYDKCELIAPTAEEKYEAAADTSNLSEDQRLFVSYLFPMSPEEKITPEHVVAFSIWLRAEEKGLQECWKAMYPYHDQVEKLVSDIKSAGITSENVDLLSRLLGKQKFELDLYDISSPANLEKKIAPLRAAYDIWFRMPKDERLQIWRYGSSDIFAAASLAHKLRFGGNDAKFTREEDRLAAIVCPGLETVSRFDSSLLEVFAQMFTSYTEKSPQGRSYKQPIMVLAKQPTMDMSSIRCSAYKEAEFRTLSEFLGTPYPKIQGRMEVHAWRSKAKRTRDGLPKQNEDSYSSVELTLGSGEVIRLDMVADGVGGHKKGSQNMGETNGQAASRIAKEVFEICALAGWITSPEDVRRTIILADMAILSEQIKRKERDDDLVENDMGCTMSVIMQHGDKFWGTHCGDSDWKVIRDGRAVFSSVGHTSEWSYYEGLKIQVHDEMRQVFCDVGYDPDALDDAVRDTFLTHVAEETHKRFVEHMEAGNVRRGGVCTALGHAAGYIHVNNAESGYQPFELEKDDIIVLCSDGVGVPICDHEFSIFAEQAGGDLEKARDNIISAAADRIGSIIVDEVDRTGRPKKEIIAHPTSCECPPRPGKPSSDDSTLMMRYGDMGLKLPVVDKKTGPRPEQTLKGPYAPAAASPEAEMKAEPTPAQTLQGPYSAVESLPETEKKAEPTPAQTLQGPYGQVEPPQQAPAEETSNETPEPVAGYKPQSFFRSQTDRHGRSLPEDSTRYLDPIVREVQGLEVVQEVARKLGLLPRDLEIMLYHAYCDDLKIAMDPHKTPEGQELNATIPTHLLTVDAESILHSAYLLYMLRGSGFSWSKKDRKNMFIELQDRISAMHPDAEHTNRLQMAAFSLKEFSYPQKPADDGRKDKKQRRRT